MYTSFMLCLQILQPSFGQKYDYLKSLITTGAFQLY